MALCVDRFAPWSQSGPWARQIGRVADTPGRLAARALARAAMKGHSMKTAMAAAVGLAVMAGPALAQRDVNPSQLQGTWDASITGDRGSADVRVIFAGNGQYLAMAVTADPGTPVPFWQTGEYTVSGMSVTFEAQFASEPIGRGEEISVIQVQSLTRTRLRATSADDPMWDQLEFQRWTPDPMSGVWRSRTPEGTALFLMTHGGGFAGGFGDSPEDMETFWGLWSVEDRTVLFEVSDGEWSADEEPMFEEHEARVERIRGDTMVLVIDALGGEALTWQRVAEDPLVGEWVSETDRGVFTVHMQSNNLFRVMLEDGGEDVVEFEGIWTLIGPDSIFFAVTDGTEKPQVLRFVMTGPSTMMLGEIDPDMIEFVRQ